MKTFGLLMIILVVAAAAGGIGFFVGRHHPVEAGETSDSAAAADEEVKPVVKVMTIPATTGSITETVTAYGTVIAQPAEVQVISAGFECRVTRILVSPGQQVAAGADVIQVEASPDVLITLQEAKNAFAGAERDLAQAQQRFKQHLATNTDLAQAEQALQSAKLKLDNLTQRGVGIAQTFKARIAGIVSKIDVQEGQIVAAGSPLVELAPANRFEVQLNVEPADAKALKPDAGVQLQPVNGANSEKTIAGKVRMIGQRVDPVTRLVDVRVSLPADTGLMLDSFVTGRLTRDVAEGFVVPRDAALPNEDGSHALFTVKEHHAVRHLVRIGVQQDNLVQVIADDLKVGDPIVVSGNYLLEDGMEVQVAEPSTQSATQPAGTRTEAKQ
jgi:membrane fusion protein (multidrug efflux system)